MDQATNLKEKRYSTQAQARGHREILTAKGPAVTMTWNLKIDRQKFLRLFDNNSSIFSIPILLKYDPAVHNQFGEEYILFVFNRTPSAGEQQLIELALSEIVYTGPAVGDVC